MKQNKYQPKGGMCGSCTKALSNCSNLHFESMPVIEKTNDALIVKCHDYHKEATSIQAIKSPS